jgi:lipopolysaccharide/colanic/teichoic acid biosynthesis glycosyltransferase
MTMIGRVNTSDADVATLTRLAAVGPAQRRAIRPGESVWVRLLVLVLAPLWLVAITIAVLVRAVRGRLPLFVVHERAGFPRRRLLVPKVATMTVPPNDRRFGGLVEIAVGAPAYPIIEQTPERWLRHSGLDELPQLALVVAGRMRIVGPRPVTFEEIEEMTGPDGVVGVDVLHPGLVGVWQLLDRHDYSLEERCELDRFMIEHWSPALQRRIVVIAARQVLRRLVGR